MSEQLRRHALAVIQPPFDGTAPPDWVRRQLAQGLGGVCLFARNTPDPVTTARLTAALRAEAPHAVIAADEEGGAVTRLESATGSSWPGNGALGRIGDPALTRAVAAEAGAFLAGAGITLAYAPTADVTSDPRNPVIGIRSFGTDAADVAEHTAAYVTGLQSAGVAACAKHFPGHGDTALDSHHDLPVLRVDQDLLDRRELLPFRAAIAAGVRTVMAGHLLLPALDPDRPASLSPTLITGLLREHLGFRGAVVTDALEMGAVARGRGLPELAVRAVAAGADLLCLGARHTDEDTVLAVRDALVAAVRDGSLGEERLTEAAARVPAVALAPPAAGRPGAPDAPLGADAAARALDLRAPGRAPGTPLLAGRPVVVTFDVPRSIAVGRRTPWGIADLVAARLPGTVALTLDPDSCDDAHFDVVLAHPDRPLVLVVRDAARHPWIADAVARLLARRPDAGIVEMGLPGPGPEAGWRLDTYGPSLASARAAVDLLLGT
ncbi:beta-N-acetylhexosaminidase [Actinacidiphila alni]|uniref:Beta-N-acetylhexosaminidase n=1 Tax=Actinacidiphila alni TaxID=380248 RepID=A0A1I2H593_9ACTN|nr:glycoside hydrolase family 3 N-terminal domain-containing protein [Actinacidiphila alni]SFF24540.1 beta-N-acetylhexosaminidase [Actinacidiphila alni]